MGLGFLVPAFLAGLAMLAVPVLLHLRQRDRDRPQRFPSFMFLEKLPIRTDQRQRVSDWPLLLLRAFALAMLVLAFSRPVFRDRATLGADTRSRAVVLLVDRSLSMGYAGVFPRALDSARAVIARLGNGDRVAVVAYDDGAEVVQRLTTDKAAAQAALSRLSPKARGTRLAPALRTARQVLLDAPFAAAELVVVSDLQRAAATGIAGVELPSGVRVRGIAVGSPAWVNSSVRTVEARRVVDGERTLLAVKARVQNHGWPMARNVNASLTVNGRAAAQLTSTLPPDGETVLTFAPVPAPDDAVTVLVSLPGDSLTADDSLLAVVPRDDALRVSLMTGREVSANETLFLERALSIGRAPEIRVTRERSVPPEGGAGTRGGVLLFWDTVPDDPDAVREAVRRGSGVVVVAGRRLAARRGDVSSLVPATMGGMADRLADRGGTLRDLRGEHPLFAPFRETPDALGAVRAWRYARLDASPQADVLARFDDGQPAVIEQRIGEGRVIVLAMPLDNVSGDFPLQPAFLPFVRQLALHVSGRDATPLWRGTGETWSLPATIANAVVTAPDGALIRPGTDSLGSAVPLADAGLYRAYAERASGEPAALLAVNVPVSESELTPMDTTELLLGVRTSAVGTDSAGRLAGTGEPTNEEELERRQNPWRVLLMLVLLFLALETWLATRGRRGTARRAVPMTRSSPEAS